VRIEKVDKLSRRLDLKMGIDKEEIGKKNNRSGSKRTRNRAIRKIKETREKDEKVVKVVEEIKRAEIKALRENKWKIRENLVLKKEKIYILKDKKLRLEVI